MSREFYVPCAQYAYPIKSSLPNFGQHIRRFMKLKSHRGIQNEESTPDATVAMTSFDHHDLTKLRQADEEDINDANTSRSFEKDPQKSRSNFNEFAVVPPVPLVSDSLSDPQTSEFSMESDARIPGILDETVAPMNRLTISSAAEARLDESFDQLNLQNIISENGAIIAGDPIAFAAALNAQLGYDRIRTYAELEARRENEPRSIPLLFFQDTSNDSFLGSSTSAVTGSSASGRFGILDQREEHEQCGSGSTDGVVVSSEVVGMDCMPLRPGPFHYLISEQAKSLVALQELQNEVGALLEFRDLVIETFPNLRHKMATSSSSSSSAVVSVMSQSQTSSHIPLPLSSPSSRRISEWEPGKVRRRVAQPVREGESSGSSLPRSRSNSHSGGSKNSATVQDSGFSTETSSKDSASTAIARPTSPRPVLDEAEDELWNLLDVIHRKGIRLREEVESLQGRLESVDPDELRISGDVLEAVRNVTRTDEENERSEDSSNEDNNDLINARIIEKAKRHDEDNSSSRDDGSKLIILRREKEQLLDKVAELEAETLSSRARAQELQTELAALSALRNGLEDRLRSVLETRNEIVTPGAQRKQTSVGQNSSGNISSPKNCGVHLRGNKQSAFTTILTSSSSSSSSSSSNKPHKNRFRTRTIDKSVLANGAVLQPIEVDADPEAAAHERRIRLGALDSVLVSPTRVAHVGDVDGVKIAAILREHSPLELQRHLITTTVHNQCLQKRLDEVEKSTGTLSERLDKAREENDDLRFQLEERNIELEGTKARVRVLERLQQRPPTEMEPEMESETEPRGELCCPEAGSSTESARDHHHSVEVKPSPRRRPPSRIPLLGSGTKPVAPKPPSTTNKNDSRESLKSLKSLNSRPPRDSSRESNAGTTKSSLSRGTARDSSRESLNRQSITTSKTSGKEASRESLNRSLSRNNNTNRDSINKITTSPTITTATTPTTTSSTTSLSRARDSLESNNTCNNNNISLYPPGTPPRRPPAPARRSQSLARPSVDNDSGKVRSSKLSFWMSNWMK